ncbi:hypothetical protein GCM10023093_10640 [Nemorincola caseinilytica]|uniref:Teneurin NHL domain-containing protein n=2 Tax=Nemorincola caseinilytica TaxID=2054315 RepID=A0ABP8NBF7_9BACT
MLATGQTMSTFAGTGKGTDYGDGGYALYAKFDDIVYMLADANSNVYVSSGHKVRKIDASGIVNTIAGFGVSGGKSGDGGPATAAKLNAPGGLALDKDGNLYISDSRNNCVRKVDREGIITTVAGNGIAGFTDDTLAIHAKMTTPTALALDSVGNLYIAESGDGNIRIRKVDQATGRISTYAGTKSTKYPQVNMADGLPAIETRIMSVASMLFMPNGDLLYIDAIFGVLRKITPDGKAYTVCGTWKSTTVGDGGPAAVASLNNPVGLCKNAKNDLFIAEGGGRRVRKINADDGVINTVAGGGTQASGDALDVALYPLTALAIDPYGNMFLAQSTKTILYYSANTPKDDEAMIIYPNPCVATAYATLPSGVQEIAKVYVLDASGRVVSMSEGPTNMAIGIHFEKAGTYVLQGISKNGKWSGKVSVVKPQ